MPMTGHLALKVPGARLSYAARAKKGRHAHMDGDMRTVMLAYLASQGDFARGMLKEGLPVAIQLGTSTASAATGVLIRKSMPSKPRSMLATQRNSTVAKAAFGNPARLLKSLKLLELWPEQLLLLQPEALLWPLCLPLQLILRQQELV